MDPKNKKIAGGVGAALAVVATLIGVSWHPPSVEQYTQDMNKCAAEIKAGQPTKDCSPEVASRRRTSPGTPARSPTRPRTPRIPNGLDVVYWIAPENGAKKAATPACLPHLPGRQSAARQDRQSRLGDRGLCRERDPHHQADPDGAEAVRVRGRQPGRATTNAAAAATTPADKLTEQRASSEARRLLSLTRRDIDADEACGRAAALDPAAARSSGRPCARHRPPRSPAPAWSPAGC